MAKITRIKASDPGAGSKKSTSSSKKPKKSAKSTKTSVETKTASNIADKSVVKTSNTKFKETPAKAKTPAKDQAKKPFILIRPFVYFGRYVKESWQEIRQVRWPSRKTTWKLFLAILVYTLLFVAIIMLLDALFSWLFNTVIS